MSVPETIVWNYQDKRILASVEIYLSAALDLKAWWDRTEDQTGRSRLFSVDDRPDANFTFTGEAPVAGRPIPVIGNVQEMFYDRPKRSREMLTERCTHCIQAQMREFVLRYLMRVSHSRRPTELPKGGADAPNRNNNRLGFRYSQLYYKLRESGAIGKFKADDRYSIIDLRSLKTEYSWVVARVEIFDFKLIIAPFGVGRPHLALPIRASSLLVLNSELIVDLDMPRPGELGRYGLGYAFLPDPHGGIRAYGPGRFEAAFQTIAFHVADSGEIRSRMVFVANRPRKALRVARQYPTLREWLLGLHPISACLRPLSALSRNVTGRWRSFSLEHLEKWFIFHHFLLHHDAVAGSRATWRQIPDWLDEESLPKWVVRGQDRPPAACQ